MSDADAGIKGAIAPYTVAQEHVSIVGNAAMLGGNDASCEDFKPCGVALLLPYGSMQASATSLAASLQG